MRILREHKADLGIAFDGDGDRDEAGDQSGLLVDVVQPQLDRLQRR